MSKQDWQKILGYDPAPELKKMILERVRDQGISLKEASAIYALPPLIIDGTKDTGPEYDNEYRPAIHIS